MKGLELKEKRKNLGLTQEELAKEVGLERRTIMKMEKMSDIDDSKSTILHNYFKSLETENSSNEFIEVMGIKIPIETWVIESAKHQDELMKHKAFSNIVDLETLKRFLEFTASLTPETLKLLDKDAVKRFLGK